MMVLWRKCSVGSQDRPKEEGKRHLANGQVDTIQIRSCRCEEENIFMNWLVFLELPRHCFGIISKLMSQCQHDTSCSGSFVKAFSLFPRGQTHITVFEALLS